jgi:hypothetical protein
MDKRILTEELGDIKYLFGYKAGNVISEQEQPEIDEYFYGDVEDLDKKHPERLVKDIDTNKIVGVYKRGVGFHPTPYGEELGYESHPKDIPYGTKMGGTEVGEFDYDDNDFME